MPILTPDDGLTARTPEEAAELQGRNYTQCLGQRKVTAGTVPCDFHIGPEAKSHVEENGGYYTCPRCKTSHDMMTELPWHGSQNREDFEQSFSAGGGTRIGLALKDQGQIGEKLIEKMGALPGYGPITWVSPTYKSPLDMAVKDWGIEVKTLGYDALHHRFIPGRPREKMHKNEMAIAEGYKGVLGVLVLLNYRTSKADIFVKEYPVDLATGKGVGAFRSDQGQHLVAEVPFDNPFMQPDHPAPVQAKPAPADAPAGATLTPDFDIPF